MGTGRGPCIASSSFWPGGRAMDKANEIIEREVRSSRPGSPEPHTIELHDDAYRGSAAGRHRIISFAPPTRPIWRLGRVRYDVGGVPVKDACVDDASTQPAFLVLGEMATRVGQAWSPYTPTRMHCGARYELPPWHHSSSVWTPRSHHSSNHACPAYLPLPSLLALGNSESSCSA